MEEKLNDYFATLRNFSRLFMQNVVDDGKSIKSDLRLSQIRAIAAFRDKNALSMKELATNIGVNLPTMTMMIDKLIEDGMAERDRDASDRRKVIVCLTARGKKIKTKFLAQRRKTAQSIFSSLNDQDKKELLKCLGGACRILEKSLKKPNK
jgi:DNA-binding MarR family transcriptional regulator